MTEEKYLDDKLNMIRAVITGSLAGAYMFGPGKRSIGDMVQFQTDEAMRIISKDVKNIYNYAKRKNDK